MGILRHPLLPHGDGRPRGSLERVVSAMFEMGIALITDARAKKRAIAKNLISNVCDEGM